MLFPGKGDRVATLLRDLIQFYFIHVLTFRSVAAHSFIHSFLHCSLIYLLIRSFVFADHINAVINLDPLGVGEK